MRQDNNISSSLISKIELYAGSSKSTYPKYRGNVLLNQKTEEQVTDVVQ